LRKAGIVIEHDDNVFLREPSRGDLARAIAVGIPPFERLALGCDRRVTRTGADEAQRWIDAATGNGRTSAAVALAARGLSKDDLDMAFSSTETALAGSPAWVPDLTAFLGSLSAVPVFAGEDIESGFVGAMAFRPAAERLLRWAELTRTFAFVEPGLIGALARQLSLRLIIGCAAVLELEAAFSSASDWDCGRDAWVERLCNFPALTHVIGTAVRQWREGTLEMIGRLAADLAHLRDSGLIPPKAARLVAIEPDLGDRHNDGRSVAVLVFDDGTRLVYKPKDGAAASIFLKLSNDLLPPASSNYLVVPRDGYHWESYVAQRSCSALADVENFFAHYGGIVRLLQFLEGRDFWIDNLRVDGHAPRFIDLECILQPRIADTGFAVKMPGFDMDDDTYEESVLASAAVTQPIVVDGVGRQDFGGLSGPGVRALPLGMWSGYGDRQNGNIWARAGRMYWRPDVAWPLDRGQPARPRDYLENLESGYRACQARLQLRREDLLEGVTSLVGAATMPVRVLMRNTWEYLVLLRASVEPSALLDANSREIVLAHVIGTAPRWGLPRDDRRRADIAWAEIDAIRDLDVPLFLSHPGETGVRTATGMLADGVFSGTALERLAARIAQLDQFDTDVQVEVMKLAVTMIPQAGA
jgi:hypothetical protein